ncbi:MAG: thioredoxin family protein [Candidatus Marinimicrobia bacterium]|nr:thioredoxin family protein [Candidatus Neomarinimicrobiota bacterium]MDD4960944.1 thioredoxin family protein [Candidatus Neomarinimicrobiota bacterium]MDD5708923.1 thioredoxin family protein [Candidatus Neomarinimicrobiota bacterium]
MKHKNVYSFRNVIMIVLAMIMVISCEKSPKPLPKLLDLGADKCIPCKEMAPILEELKKEYAGVLEVEFIDVWKPENQQAAVKYGIRSIPTQIFFDPEGKELWRHVGFISKDDILKKWKELGYPLKAKDAAIVQDDCADCSGCGETEESRTCE